MCLHAWASVSFLSIEWHLRSASTIVCECIPQRQELKGETRCAFFCIVVAPLGMINACENYMQNAKWMAIFAKRWNEVKWNREHRWKKKQESLAAVRSVFNPQYKSYKHLLIIINVMTPKGEIWNDTLRKRKSGKNSQHILFTNLQLYDHAYNTTSIAWWHWWTVHCVCQGGLHFISNSSTMIMPFKMEITPSYLPLAIVQLFLCGSNKNRQ